MFHIFTSSQFPYEYGKLKNYKHTNDMNCFHGCLLFMHLFFLFVKPSMSGRENPLVELSSRDDLVEIAGYGEEKLSSVLVTGTVLCQACMNGEAEPLSWPISGALVAASCKIGPKNLMKLNRAQGITDEYGDFIIDLPSHLHAIPNLDKACTIRVLRLTKKTPCHRISIIGRPKRIGLSSVGNGIRTYTAGTIRFQRASKHSHSCQKKFGARIEKTLW